MVMCVREVTPSAAPSATSQTRHNAQPPPSRTSILEDETGDDLQCDHDEGEDQQDRGSVSSIWAKLRQRLGLAIC